MLDRELLSEMQLVLIEPPDGGDTWPSLIWTRDEVLDALNGGVRALVHDLHFTIDRVEIPVAAGALSVPLPFLWLATVSLVWRASTNVRTPLGPVDSFEGDLAAPGWETTPGLPLGYADLDASSLLLRLIPTPAAAGTIELLYVRHPPLITGDAPGAELPLPDVFTTAVKYNALGWLLRKVGRLLDAERAAYCERRSDLAHTVSEILLGGWS